MSTHPNVILKCTIKAQGTTRGLLRKLLQKNREDIPDEELPFLVDNTGKILTNLDGVPSRQSRPDDELSIGNEVYRTGDGR